MKIAKQRKVQAIKSERPIGYYRNRPNLVRAYLADGANGPIFEFRAAPSVIVQ